MGFRVSIPHPGSHVVLQFTVWLMSTNNVVMFRIVEDDSPPIPDDCSPLLRDFLMLCFQKKPDMRPSAEVLFQHDWLKTAWAQHKVRLIPFHSSSTLPQMI